MIVAFTVHDKTMSMSVAFTGHNKTRARNYNASLELRKT